MPAKKTIEQKMLCPNGHSFFKSSDCPVCPVCEKGRKPADGFLSRLGAPARRALENKGVYTINRLAGFTEKEILQLHGMGPSSLPKLKAALTESGLSFRTG